MHTLEFGKYSMHFNSDLSGEIQIENADQTFPQVMHVPGELLRMYVRKYVLNQIRDGFANLLYRQVAELGGLHHKDAVQILEQIDQLAPISTTSNPTNVLHGVTYLFGSKVHVTFLRVQMLLDGKWSVYDSDYADELDRVMSLAEGGQLKAVTVPGFAGDYIAYTYPDSE